MSTAKPGTSETSSMKSSLVALAEAAGGASRVGEPAVWTLPSGEDLLHYALKGGFLAPGILGVNGSAPEESSGVRQSRTRQGREDVR